MSKYALKYALLKYALMIVCLLSVSSTAAFCGVSVTSPVNGETLPDPVPYVATANTSSCAKGVASMGIYTAPGVLAYVVNGASMNTTLNLSPGTYNTVVEEWDYCGGASTTGVTITVSSAGVHVTAPANGGNVGSPVNYVATATSSCAKGVASMGIYTAPGVLAYVVNGASMNTNLSLNPGTYDTVVEEWDYCGGAATTPINITVSSQSGVNVTAPSNGGTVGSPVNFVATATTSCAKGVGSMGIYTAPYQLAYVVNGSSLNTSLPLSPGTYNTVVEEWDNCGGAATTPVTITVSSENEFKNLQASGGWAAAGQGPPQFIGQCQR